MTETRGSTAVPDRGGPDPGATAKERLPARVSLYYRQVIAELRKVIWPTRKELVTYTSVVLVFVMIIIAYVTAIDLAFGEFALRVFG